ncbi:MAG TPA: hypothetical protein VE817_05970, partial [Candidatus Acidoferrum sp.]|nr:hypothetical protein [Candidatus Acidoferrum sp.]
LTAIGAEGVAAALGRVGPSLLGGLVPLVAISVIYSRGVKTWFAHDALERRIIRREHIGTSGLASAHSEAALVSGGLVAIIVASWTGSLALVILTLGITAIVSAILRFAGPRPPTETAIANVAEMRRAGD